MSDVISRIKIDSNEFDSKIKRATQNLLTMEQECRKVNGTLAVLEKDQLEYVKSLGMMETVSTSARGKIKELTQAFTELSVQYNRLTDEEKNGDYGKALSASLDQLKNRINESKSELDSINKSLNGSGGLSDALNSVAGKFGLSIDQVTKFGGVVGLTTTAVQVCKDAFFNNEEQLDEWGRVVESSHSLYTGFLNALNTGDISGYLSNINQIVQAARDAYDALDNLGTYNAFNQINVERTRTNMTESIADYRGGKGTKDAVKAAGEAYKKELQDRKRLENDAYLAAVKRVATERGVSAKDLTDALSGTYGHYQDLKNVQPTGVRQTVVGAGMFARTGTETFAQTRQEKLGEALRHLNDTELQNLQALGAQAQRTGNEIAQVDKQLTRVLNGRQPGAGGGGSKGGSTTTTLAPTYAADSIAAQEALVASLTKQWREASSELREGYLKDLTDAKNKLEGMKLVAPKGVDTSGSPVSISTETIIPSIDEIRDYLEKNPIKIPVEAASDKIKGIMKTASITADVVGSIGDAFNAIEDPAAKVAGTIAQAIASVALGYATATANAGSMGPWAWVAFAATGLAEMLTMISTIHSATGYASGGIVSGNSFSGDNVPAMVGNTVVGLNAGELILNKSQQNNIASQLTQAGGGGRLVAKLKGRDILISLERELSETGKGQLATWR